MDVNARIAAFDAIARPGGGFAIVADDGRESLRRILRDAGRPHQDADLTAFKVLVAEQLGPAASAVLVDTVYGEPALDALAAAAPETGRIVAVDRFTEPRFGPLQDSHLDEPGMDAAVAAREVHALKLYLYWHPDQPASEREEECRAFVDGCARLGVLSILEGVVKLPADDPRFDVSLVAAAEEFGAFGPDMYKTQVPTVGRGTAAAIEGESLRVSRAAGVPWVALSNGIAAADFPDAVAAVCAGGASGFLAGRGSWSPAVGAPDPAQELATAGVARVAELAARVDAEACPWWEAAGLPAPGRASA